MLFILIRLDADRQMVLRLETKNSVCMKVIPLSEGSFTIDKSKLFRSF